MHTSTFTALALLAANVLAKPIAHRPWFPHRPSNTAATSSSGCVATCTATSDKTCGDAAAKYGIPVSAYQASTAADSVTCIDLLADYRICVVIPTATSSPTAFPAAQTSSLSTITTTNSTTFVYITGSGAAASVLTVTSLHATTQVITYTNTVGYSRLSTSSSPILYATTTLSTSSLNAPYAATTSTRLSSTSSTVSSSTSLGLSNSSISPAASVSSACSTTSSPPAPTQTGIVSGCAEWYIAVAGEYCSSVATHYGLDVDTFMAWNPAVGSPDCPNMHIGDAYCVAICGGASISQSSSTTESDTTSLSTPTTASLTSASASSTATASPNDVYKMYTGDGSAADGWPAQSQWIDFDTMFDANTDTMKASCAQWGVPNDSDDELADMKTAINSVATSTEVDARVILAIIMQESTGCVRVITTQYSVYNPGLMQSHNGTGTCNTNNAALGLPGVDSTGTVKTPCPASEITQMIQDGTGGTTSGDGYSQCLQKQGNTDVSKWYRAARMYNGGSIDPSGDLGKGCCTACYASDVANRLTGWVNAPHGCTL